MELVCISKHVGVNISPLVWNEKSASEVCKIVFESRYIQYALKLLFDKGAKKVIREAIL